MDFLQLHYFYDSSITENFSHTAERYLVPTSSVSASVRRLEKELGCTLFDRSHNKITLNENGRILQQSLCILFDELDNTVKRLSVDKTEVLEVRILVKALREWITDRIIECKKRNPHTDFRISYDVKEVNYENYDVIIDYQSETYPDHDQFELHTAELCLMAAADSSFGETEYTLLQFSKQPFIVVGDDNGSLHKILSDACIHAGFFPNIVAHANDIVCFRKLLEADTGIGIGSKSFCVNNPKIKLLNVTDFHERQTLYCYYKKVSDHKKIHSFLNMLK